MTEDEKTFREVYAKEYKKTKIEVWMGKLIWGRSACSTGPPKSTLQQLLRRKTTVERLKSHHRGERVVPFISRTLRQNSCTFPGDCLAAVALLPPRTKGIVRTVA